MSCVPQRKGWRSDQSPWRNPEDREWIPDIGHLEFDFDFDFDFDCDVARVKGRCGRTGMCGVRWVVLNLLKIKDFLKRMRKKRRKKKDYLLGTYSKSLNCDGKDIFLMGFYDVQHMSRVMCAMRWVCGLTAPQSSL